MPAPTYKLWGTQLTIDGHGFPGKPGESFSVTLERKGESSIVVKFADRVVEVAIDGQTRIAIRANGADADSAYRTGATDGGVVKIYTTDSSLMEYVTIIDVRAGAGGFALAGRYQFFKQSKETGGTSAVEPTHAIGYKY